MSDQEDLQQLFEKGTPVKAESQDDLKKLFDQGTVHVEPTFEQRNPRTAKVLKFLGETGAGLGTGASRLFEFADPALAAAAAAGQYVVPGFEGNGSFGERWKGEMEGLRRTRAEIHDKAPVADTVGQVISAVNGLPMAGNLPSFSGAVQKAGAATRAAAGVMDAATMNAISSAGANADRDPLGAAAEGATSPMNLVGAAPTMYTEGMPNVKQGINDIGTAFLQKALPKGKPTPDAQRLMDNGIDLTTGQALGGLPNRTEDLASKSHSPPGVMVEQMREHSQGQLHDAMLKQALPPGMKEVPDAATIPEKIKKVAEGFDVPYSQIRDQQVYPAIHDGQGGTPLQSTGKRIGAFDALLEDPNVAATDQDKTMVKRFLDNQLSLLPGGKTRPNMVEQVDAGDLMNMRSNIRKQVRKYQNDDSKIAYTELLDMADDKVTQALESQLEPKKAALLKQTDAQYAKYKLFEKASARAGSSGEWGPRQFDSVLRQSVGDSAFAKGGGGELRSLNSAAQNVFDRPNLPSTGVRSTAMGVAGKYLNAPVAVGQNFPLVKAIMTGQPLPPRAPQAPRTLDPNVARLLSTFLRGNGPDNSMAELLRKKD